MTSEVRYQPGGDNAVLRHVLCEVWNLECYWCREYKKYLELEIDHIVAFKGPEGERKRLRKQFKLQADYDVHAVTNLAPICRPCNRAKTNEDMTQYPVVLTVLKKARKHAPAVTIGVQQFRATTDLGGALLKAINADLSDPETRAAFVVGAPAIVQRLAELGLGKADYLVHRNVSVEGRDEGHSFFVSLDEHGRTAMAMLEEVAGGKIDEALSDPIDNLFLVVANEIADEIRSREDRIGQPEVGSVEISWPSLAIRKMTYTAVAPAQLQFEFEGTFDGLATASVSRPSLDGSELEDAQGDSTFSTNFRLELAWDPSDAPGAFTFDQVWLDGFEAETLIDGESDDGFWDWPDDSD
jgi:hypothetical protein